MFIHLTWKCQQRTGYIRWYNKCSKCLHLHSSQSPHQQQSAVCQTRPQSDVTLIILSDVSRINSKWSSPTTCWELFHRFLSAIAIGATLYVTMVTCHHHFWRWWWLSPPLFQIGICKDAYFHIKIPIFPCTLGKRIVFFLLPEAFCGLKYADNAIAAGSPPRTPLGELTTLPQTP